MKHLSRMHHRALGIGAALALAILVVAGIGHAHAVSTLNPLPPPVATRMAWQQSIMARAPSRATSVASFQQQELDYARAHPLPKPAVAVHPTPWPSPTPHSGIFDRLQGPFPYSHFEVRDAWLGWMGSTWVTVYAGVHHPKLNFKVSEGALLIYTEQPYGSMDTLVGLFPAPTGPDALTITAASGNVLRLSTASGKTLSFDLRTHQYTAP